MKVYVKCKVNPNSGLWIGHSENFTKAIYGFSELGAEIVPYRSLDDIYDTITKEDINEQQALVQSLDTEREKIAYDIDAMTKKRQELSNQHEGDFTTAYQMYQDQWNQWQNDQKRFQKSTKEIEKMTSQIQDMETKILACQTRQQDLSLQKEKWQVQKETLKKATPFESLLQAEQQWQDKHGEMKNKKQAYETIHDDLEKVSNEWHRLATLKSKYEQELPQRKQWMESTQATFLKQQKEQPIDDWQTYVTQYTKEDVETWKRSVDTFKRSIIAIHTQIQDAQQLIKNRPRPDIKKMEETLRSIEETAKETSEHAVRSLSQFDNNQKTMQKIKAQWQQHQNTLHMYGMYDRLYRQLSGNIPGSRMDIETYVQRTYLARILDAANARFLEMSSACLNCG